MISPEFARTMSRYNRWQNRSLTSAASTLSDEARWQDRGAFFRSIAETLNHILWDDRVWLARLNRDEDSARRIGDKHPYTDTPRRWLEYIEARALLDDETVSWADELTEKDLRSSTTWLRGADTVETGFGFNLVHMFNHQTHHRGQVHAMLTAAGAKPEPSDLQMLKVLGET